jgi:hypothetical protein
MSNDNKGKDETNNPYSKKSSDLFMLIYFVR